MATLREEVYGKVKWLVISGALEADSPIVERTLSSELGSSRTPLREALAQLAEDGFVHKTPGKGYVVGSFTFKKALELFDLRLCIESYMIRKHKINVDISKLIRINQEYRAAAQRGDAETYLRKNTDFHQTLISGIGNSVVQKLGESMQDMQLWLSFTMQYHQLVDTEAAVKEHEEIIAALAVGDQLLASELLWRHIDQARKRFYSAISRES